MYLFRNFFLLTSIILLFACSESNEKNTYYIDGALGSDLNSGTSPDDAWQTLAKINSTDFEPGNKILLKKGQIFHGSISLDEKDKGTDALPIHVGTFGGVDFTEPIIESGAGFAITLRNCSWLSISGLVLHGAGRKTGNTTSGLIMDQCSNVDIDSVRVSGYQQHGIEVLSSENIRNTHVKAHDNSRTGIRSGGDRAPDSQDFPTKNIYIGYSATFDNAGDIRLSTLMRIVKEGLGGHLKLSVDY